MSQVDLNFASWLKSDSLLLTATAPTAQRWAAQGGQAECGSPFGTLAGAEAEATRRAEIVGYPRVRDRAVVAGEQRALIGRCITLRNPALGYAGGQRVLVIGAAEQENGTTVLTVLRRLGYGYAISPAALPADAVFDRASAATRFRADGVLVSEAVGVPRFDFDPATGAYRGLLLEPERTNAMPQSNGFADWTRVGAAVDRPGGTTAPDGTAMWRLADAGDGSSGQVYLERAHAASSGPQALSIFARAGLSSRVRLSAVAFSGATGTTLADFDLAAMTASAGGVIEDVGAGVRRCWIAPNLASDVNGSLRVQLLGPTGSTTLARNGAASVHLFGAQSENAAAPSSYIPTGSAAVLRAADVLRLPGRAGSWRVGFDDGSHQDVPLAEADGRVTLVAPLNRERVLSAEHLG